MVVLGVDSGIVPVTHVFAASSKVVDARVNPRIKSGDGHDDDKPGHDDQDLVSALTTRNGQQRSWQFGEALAIKTERRRQAQLSGEIGNHPHPASGHAPPN